MYDPSTVAHEIKLPIVTSKWTGKDGTVHKHYYTLFTIWHEDPQKRREGYCTTRGDDTCGWFNPPCNIVDKEAMEKLSKQQYREICAQQVNAKEGKSYAYVSNDPNSIDAAYWCWRAIKHHFKKKVAWQYGTELSWKEYQHLFMLVTNPVDNIRFTFTQIHDEESFRDFFMCVYRSYCRFYRPWYKHPRWHIHHWRIQFHPWQQFYRRFFQKCDICGKRGFPKGVSAMGDWSGKRTWHSTCDSNVAQAAAKKVDAFDIGSTTTEDTAM